VSDAWRWAAAVLTAYLAGSIPFGVVVARARGVDVQRAGSGNIGATNVARTVGRGYGVLVLALDALKGALPLLVAIHVLAVPARLGPWVTTAMGLAAVAGHCWPPWLAFRGGKGVATALGVLLVLDPGPCLAAAAVWAVVMAIWRVAAVASLVAAVTALATAIALGRPAALLALTAGSVAIIGLRHRDNVRRLLAGEEQAAALARNKKGM
jgi:glycerol-3-phosphate acyltransferase PlsY